MGGDNTGDAGNMSANEPRNIINSVKYSLDLPLLHDNDMEVEDLLERCRVQLVNANNGMGVNAREEKYFPNNILGDNNTRRAGWDLL